MQECAFSGLENNNLTFKPLTPDKPLFLGLILTGLLAENCFTTVDDAPCKLPLIVIVIQ